MEQTSSLHPMNQSDGSTVYMEGIADSKTTFKKLFSGYYVPFTFAEFHGLNPVEKGEVLFSSTENLDTVDRLRIVTLTANYPITSLEFRVFSPAGENLYSKILHPAATNSYSWELNSIIYPNMITFLNGSNTLKIFVRLSTGEELEVFQGVVRS